MEKMIKLIKIDGGYYMWRKKKGFFHRGSKNFSLNSIILFYLFIYFLGLGEGDIGGGKTGWGLNPLFVEF